MNETYEKIRRCLIFFQNAAKIIHLAYFSPMLSYTTTSLKSCAHCHRFEGDRRRITRIIR